MLFLVFAIGEDAYAIDVAQVVEVLPLVRCKQVPHAPVGLAGLFNYHGALIPLIDVSELVLGSPCKTKMSTRIIVTTYIAESASRHTIGLKAEQVMETLRREKKAFKEPSISIAGSPYLGPVTIDNGRIIQQIKVDQIVSAGIQEQLLHGIAGQRQ